jgi:hypothetical protein
MIKALNNLGNRSTEIDEYASEMASPYLLPGSGQPGLRVGQPNTGGLVADAYPQRHAGGAGRAPKRRGRERSDANPLRFSIGQHHHADLPSAGAD